MPNVPSIIKGPAKITWNSFTYHSKGDITVAARHVRNPIESTLYGQVAEAHFALAFEISFEPVGQKPSDFNQYFPHMPSDIGNSIFGGGALVIQTKDGRTITYEEAGISAMPILDLSPRRTCFRPMTFTAIGQKTGVGTAADNYKTISATSYADTAFDPDSIHTDVYSAAHGGTSPYDDMSALDGFQLIPSLSVQDILSDDQGISDIVIAGVVWTAAFIPSNLTEAEIDTLVKLQNSGALVPGSHYDDADNLVISPDNTGITATLKTCLPAHGGGVHSPTRHQHEPIVWIHKLHYSTGAPVDPVTFA